MKPDSSQIIQPPAAQAYVPGLYLVATPIGHLKDITLRALEMLAQADLILCEDTRVTAKLLHHYGIHASTLSYNDHNGEERRPQILAALGEGKRIALVSDAGTPLISDPGYKLVQDAIARGFHVTALPGASSVLAALCLSGLPTHRFCFAGFLPPKQEACRKALQSLADIPATLVFLESTRRLNDTLALMLEVLGNRRAAVLRELTKLFEEARRATLAELCEHYRQQGEPKGEIVIVVEQPHLVTAGTDGLAEKLGLLLESHSVKEAAAILAEQTGRPRKEIYALALTLAGK